MTERPVILHLHIPKTGGTTLNKYIYKHWSTEKTYVAEDNHLHSGVYYFPTGFLHEGAARLPDSLSRVLLRNDLRAIVGHFCYGMHRYVNRPWAYVTLLRNPLDRILSLYYHLSPTGAINIEEFISNPTYKIFENDQTRRLAGIDPKSDRCTKQTLCRAKANLHQHFSVVGVTERFDETLVLLKRKFGWTEKLDYYLKNVNTRRPKVTFPPAVIDAIRTRNAFDFELYGYAKALLGAAISAQDVWFHEELERFISTKNSVAQIRNLTQKKRKSCSVTATKGANFPV
jgi:hypothetical protein